MNPGLLLLIGVLGVVATLALIGVALWMMRRERDTAAKGSASPAASASSSAGTPDAAAAAPAASPATDRATSSTEASGAATDEPVEVLRVLRPHAGGNLMVEIGGVRYGRVNDIKDQQQGLNLVDTIVALQHFVGLDLGAPAAPTSSAESTEPAVESDALQRPSMNPIKQMFIMRDRGLRRAREIGAAVSASSIVEEINELLESRLVGSAFDGRSIHMRPGLHGGAHIDVDGQGYSSVEEVADLEVRAFLKSVIAEWEREADRR